MARKQKKVPLTTPFSIHNKNHTEIVLQEPTAKMFFDLGPMTTNFAKGGVVATHDLEGVLLAYLEGGCVVNIDCSVVAIMLADLPLVDGIRLRREFNSFFTEAVDEVLLAEAKAASDAVAGAKLAPAAGLGAAG